MKRMKLGPVFTALSIGLGPALAYATLGITGVQPVNPVVGKGVGVNIVVSQALASFSTTCPSVEISYGDGAVETLPINYVNKGKDEQAVDIIEGTVYSSHAYAQPGVFSVSAKFPQSAANCGAGVGASANGYWKVTVSSSTQSNTMSNTLGIASPDEGSPTWVGGLTGLLNGLSIPLQPSNGPANINKGSNIALVTVNGPSGGSCEKATIDWGDGTTGEVHGPYPIQLPAHTYKTSGMMQIRVAAVQRSSCGGNANASFYAYPKPNKINNATWPSTANSNQAATFTVSGQGVCSVNVDPGTASNAPGSVNNSFSGSIQFLPDNNFSWKINLVYPKAGTYQATVAGCGSSFSHQITVFDPLLPGVTTQSPGTPTRATNGDLKKIPK